MLLRLRQRADRGSLTFTPGETTKVVRVPLLDCTDVEPLISFRFTLSQPNANATIARASTLVSIVNDSTVVATPRLVMRDAIVDEKDGSVLVPVLLGGPAGQASDDARLRPVRDERRHGDRRASTTQETPARSTSLPARR